MSPNLVLLAIFILVVNADILGVSPANQKFYVEKNGKFICLDGSREIPFPAVNDDYCDCPDFSDEPGTSACPRGVFYCNNQGYFPETIPSSRVSDGICDCCDGSDESRGTCSNTCAQLGAAAKAEIENEVREQQIGWDLNAKGIEEAVKEKQERLEKLKSLKETLAGLQVQLDAAAARKKEAVDAETEALEEYDRKLAATPEKRLENHCSNLRLQIDSLINKLDSFRDGLEELDEKLQNGEKISLLKQIEEIEHLRGIVPTYPDICSSKEEEETEQGEEVEGEEGEGEEDDEEEDRGKRIPYPDAEVAAADKARAEYVTIENEFRGIEVQIKDLEKIEGLDLGKNLEFYNIYNKCFEYTTPEYIYEFCPYSKTAQKPKRGGGETSLGLFSKWDDNYGKMIFDKGLRCWGGPDRSTTVEFKCGSTNQLVAVDEPAKCEYAFRFLTPYACQSPKSADQILRARFEGKRDEL